MGADELRDLDAAGWARLWGVGRLPVPGPLQHLDGLLQAVGMLHRVGHPDALRRELEERRELGAWGDRDGGEPLSDDELADREAQIGFAEQALYKVEAWGCSYRDGAIPVPDGGRGRPVDLLTVAVGLLRDSWGPDYTRIHRALSPYWPDVTREKVQRDTNRFDRKLREANQSDAASLTPYDRALGRLSPRGGRDRG